MKRWEDHYKARVDNRFYLRSFIIKYKRFLDEIIINIKSMPEKGIVFKEEGCGIGTVSRALNVEIYDLCKALGVAKESYNFDISKVICTDIDRDMLTLCCENTYKMEEGLLSSIPFSYLKEDIRQTKFFEYPTVVVTHGVLEHFEDEDITQIMETYKDRNVRFHAHYVPTDKYEKPSFGDERLMPVSKWVSLTNPDYYIVDNAGCDLYLFFNNKQ